MKVKSVAPAALNNENLSALPPTPLPAKMMSVDSVERSQKELMAKVDLTAVLGSVSQQRGASTSPLGERKRGYDNVSSKSSSVSYNSKPASTSSSASAPVAPAASKKSKPIAPSSPPVALHQYPSRDDYVVDTAFDTNAIPYPKTGIPPADFVKAAYESRNGTGKCNVLDLINATSAYENEELKKVQAFAQKSRDNVSKGAVERARQVAKDFALKAPAALEAAREETVEQLADRRRAYGPNVDNWKNVQLMTHNLAALKAEERAWRQSLDEIEERRRAVVSGAVKTAEEDRLQDELEAIVRPDDFKRQDEGLKELGLRVEGYVADITLQADRISQTLRGVRKTVDEAAVVKGQLHAGFTKKMFEGYEGVNDPKGLVRGLMGV